MTSQFSKVPPNILVLADDENEFKRVKLFVQKILGKNSYTIYNLNLADLQKSSVWIPSCRLLISLEQFNLCDEALEQKIKTFTGYLRTGGKILSVPSLNDNLEQDLRKFENGTILFHREKYLFESHYESDLSLTKKEGQLNLLKSDDLFYTFESTENPGSHFISKVFIESDNHSPQPFLDELFLRIFSEYFQLTKAQESNNNTQLKENYIIFSKNKLLQSVNVISKYLHGTMKKEANIDLESTKADNFEHKKYFENLQAKSIGSIIMYSDLVESTMNSITNLVSSLDSIVVVARQQIQGQGNNKNEWLSPIGCCMFTLYLNLNSNNFSTSRICLLQFAAGLSCVKAVKSIKGCEDFAIGIKWPNDVYFEGKIKLGGVLVKSSIMGSQIGLKIGIGFNLDNQHPTVCLNSILRGKKLPECSQEVFMANFFNFFESYVSLLSQPNFNSWLKFSADFQENWIHQNQKVRINFWDEDAEIIGINEFGYLKVRRSDKTEHCLQPDGNRFDLMQNLIVLR
ncbi:biotin-- ligase [Brachionus plicatilis]|uniref:Biotin--ligase n=1 Tax=Brachionus plicatilis TaxID=10195 RepID=A0A3M7QJ64_BRAPC|nr:biotin-- ligase [Brachionus plicatilis]